MSPAGTREEGGTRVGPRGTYEPRRVRSLRLASISRSGEPPKRHPPGRIRPPRYVTETRRGGSTRIRRILRCGQGFRTPRSLLVFLVLGALEVPSPRPRL